MKRRTKMCKYLKFWNWLGMIDSYLEKVHNAQIDNYLNDSKDIYELEHRMRLLDTNRACIQRK